MASIVSLFLLSVFFFFRVRKSKCIIAVLSWAVKCAGNPLRKSAVDRITTHTLICLLKDEVCISYGTIGFAKFS